MERTLPVVLSIDTGAEKRGEAHLVEFDHSTRVKRTVKVLGFWWGLAVCAIVLPILHFVLVPGLAIAGPVLAWITFHRESLIVGGTAECPKCSAPFAISKSKPAWPLQDTCGKCHEPVWIRPAI